METNYKYDIAFSFLKQDEVIAFDINDLLQDRFSTFIYSKKQEELGGTDGEEKFNKVFNIESRVVVVLFRDGWGKTSWTRIEEIAIKNRAFDNGWEFFLLINLDKNSEIPKWIPRTYIWFDYERWKSKGAAPVIEQKIKECGGITKPESIEDKAKRLIRKREAERKRQLFLTSPEALNIAKQEVISIIKDLKKIKNSIEDPSSNFTFGVGERPNEMYEFGYRNLYLCFNWDRPYAYELEVARLKVSLYEKHGHYGLDYHEDLINKKEYRFDQYLLENNGWSNHQTGKDFIVTKDLIDNWVSDFLNYLEKRKTAVNKG